MTVISDIDTIKNHVLTYLKKIKLQNQVYYEGLSLYCVKPNDIIKYIEHPEKCSKFPLDFIATIENAIIRISKKYLIDFPIIESQTEEDRVLSKLLRKNSFFAFGTNTFFREEITINHIIAYMERDEIIYLWNADFVLKTQHEVKRAKAFLL